MKKNKDNPSLTKADFQERLDKYKEQSMKLRENLQEKYQISEKQVIAKQNMKISALDRALMWVVRKRGVGIASLYQDLKKKK